MAQARVSCEQAIAVAPDVLWPVLAGFDVGWHPFIAKSQVFRAPNGAVIRRFTDHDGQEYQERRSYHSDTDRVQRYEMLNGIAGAHSYCAELQVTAQDGGSLVTWQADIHARAARAEEIAEGTRAVFTAGLETLAELARTNQITAQTQGQPHRWVPRPAPPVMPVATTLPGVPPLRILAPESQSDTLVLFLHGIGGNAENWADQLAALGGDFPVAALNLRGYGPSGLGPDQTQIDDYCADILRVMQARGARRVVLVGLSLGAWIATSFAMRHGDLLAGLVLAGGCTGMSEAPAAERYAFRHSREVPLDAGQSPADFAASVVQIIAGPGATPVQQDRLLASMAAIPRATYRDALRCFCAPVERFDFARIPCPVLLMTGAHDRLAPPAEIRAVAARIAQASPAADVQFEVIQDAGHVCNIEAPAQVNALLRAYLARLPGLGHSDRQTTLEKQYAKRERIRRAAHDEFCENGFDGASMDRIAARADVSKPTLYQYFDSKEGLLDAVLDVGRNQIVAPLMTGDDPLAERLWRFAWAYADFVLRPDMLSLARLILGEATRRPETAIRYHQNGPGRAFEGLVEFISAAAQAGALRVDAADLAAQDLWSLILSGPRDHYLHHVQDRPDKAELTRVITHGLRLFLRGYSTDPAGDLAALDRVAAAAAVGPAQDLGRTGGVGENISE